MWVRGCGPLKSSLAVYFGELEFNFRTVRDPHRMESTTAFIRRQLHGNASGASTVIPAETLAAAWKIFPPPRMPSPLRRSPRLGNSGRFSLTDPRPFRPSSSTRLPRAFCPERAVRLTLVVLVLQFLAATWAGRAIAQERTATPDSLARVRLFLDCNGLYCDPDFYQTEIAFVDHVRDRQDADVHVLITPQQTGGGGTAYTMTFEGRRRFAGRTDTLQYVSLAASTEDDRRRGLARMIKIGLVPYIANTPLASNLDVTYCAPAGVAPTTTVAAHDPWNFWTFRSQVNGYFSGESRTRFGDMSGRLSANRITDAWKLQLSTNGGRSTSEFEIDDTTTVTSEQHSYGVNGLVAKSLTPHLSAGIRALASASTFVNQDLRVRVAPAIEYDFYPYSEATRRQLIAQYSIGVDYFDFHETTIFGADAQSMLDHRLLLSLDQKQGWGSLSVAVEGAQYLHDTSRYSSQIFSDLEIRLFKGLSLNLYGSVSYVRDQIYLPAGDASPEEVLLRLRQLDTSYRYFGQVGVSYTFGSIYNNVVNPRFSGGGG